MYKKIVNIYFNGTEENNEKPQSWQLLSQVLNNGPPKCKAGVLTMPSGKTWIDLQFD